MRGVADPTTDSPSAGRQCIWLLVLTGVLLCLRLGATPLLGPDEPRYARVAVEMNRAHAWVLPTLGGRVWMEKPVLYYWLAKPALALFGETELAVRLPSALAGVVSVLFVFLVGCRLLGRRAGFYSALIMATAVLAFVYSRAAAMDALLAACVTGAIGLAALRLFEDAGPWTLVGAYALAGLATLAKGPLGILLPTLVFGTYWLTTRRKQDLTRLVSVGGLLAFAVVAVPWYALITAREGRDFLDVFILNHNIQRFTSTIHHHPGPVFYYLPILLAGLFPWTALLPLGLGRLQPAKNPRHRFLLVWLVAPLVFFSLAGSKLPGYIVPCVAPLALVTGAGAASLTAADQRRSSRWLLPAGAAINLVVAALLVALPFVLRAQGHSSWRLLLLPGAWAAGLGILGLLWARRPRVVRLLALGAPGLLVLLALTTPRPLAEVASGKALFEGIPPRDEILVLGASRSAWMAGYFYHEGRVREMPGGATAVLEAAARQPVLVLCGRSDCRRLAEPGYSVETLRFGPRHSRLVSVSRRRGTQVESPPS